MTPKRKKQLAVGAGALTLLLLAMRRTGKGDVLIGPVTVTPIPLDKGTTTNADLQRITLALVHSRQLMGADPNTLASRKPSATEEAYINQTLATARLMNQASHGAVPYPTAEEQRLALSKTLPGDALQVTNSQLYALLGVDPAGSNEATVPLTPAIETAARALIAKWRPYSQSAVDTLFVLLDESRDLGAVA
jgi:hypothetical protein